MRNHIWLIALVALGCGSDAETGAMVTTDAGNVQPVTLQFAAEVGGQPFVCNRTYSGIGTMSSDYEAQDVRFYVHDVRAITASGEVPVTLSEDSAWQARGVALLDFRNGGSCSVSAPPNTTVTGTVPMGTTITGIRFKVGVPEAENHLDPASAPAPLNVVTMFWGWEAGFQHLHIEGRLAGTADGRLFHLGSTNCSGDVRAGTRACANSNRPAVELTSFDPATQTIVADLADLYATSDLSVDQGGDSGCRSKMDDPECATLFAAVGLDGSTQQLFRAESR